MNKVVLVRMNSDNAFWINGNRIASGDAEFDDLPMIEEVARNTAATLRDSAPGGCDFQIIDRDTPEDPEWNWDDVEAELQLGK